MHKKKNIFVSVIIISLIFFYFPPYIFGQIQEEPTPELQQTTTDSSTPRKDNVEVRKEIKSQKREQFETKMSQIHDEKKQAIVARLDQQFAVINKKQTDRMWERLERLTNIVAQLQDHLTNLQNEEKDTAPAETAITNAQKTIDTSKTAVTAQTAKEYVPQITTETTLKQTVGATSSQLQTDLATTHKTIITAHQAVVKTHQALLSMREVVAHPTTAPSVNETPNIE